MYTYNLLYIENTSESTMKISLSPRNLSEMMRYTPFPNIYDIYRIAHFSDASCDFFPLNLRPMILSPRHRVQVFFSYGAKPFQQTPMVKKTFPETHNFQLELKGKQKRKRDSIIPSEFHLHCLCSKKIPK